MQDELGHVHWDEKEFKPSIWHVRPINSDFPQSITVEDFEEHFSKYKSYILSTSLTKENEMVNGFITFACEETAESARREFCRTILCGCMIQLVHFEITNTDTCSNPPMEISNSERWKISMHLFQFIKLHHNEQINSFNKDGGTFEYRDGIAIISCVERDLAINFLGKIYNKYTENTIRFENSMWSRLNMVRANHKCSILDKAKSLFSDWADCDVIVQVDNHVILLVGTRNGVDEAHLWLMNQLNGILEVER